MVAAVRRFLGRLAVALLAFAFADGALAAPRLPRVPACAGSGPGSPACCCCADAPAATTSDPGPPSRAPHTVGAAGGDCSCRIAPAAPPAPAAILAAPPTEDLDSAEALDASPGVFRGATLAAAHERDTGPPPAASCGALFLRNRVLRI